MTSAGRLKMTSKKLSFSMCFKRHYNVLVQGFLKVLKTSFARWEVIIYLLHEIIIRQTTDYQNISEVPPGRMMLEMDNTLHGSTDG